MRSPSRTRTSRRALLVWLAALAVATGLVPALAASPAAADVSDFSFDSWHVDYRLDVDEDGRAVAHVTERLIARFPDFDQNRGIVRMMPGDYQGSDTDPRDFAVTDGEGSPLPFEIEEDDGFVAVLTGDDEYVHGVQEYVIDYTLSDVVLMRDDGTADEFYWDAADVEHAQPVEAFSARVEFSPALAERLTGDARCYTGAARSDGACSIERGTDSPAAFEVPPFPLEPHQGVTLAVGLEPGSVVQPSVRLPNPVVDTAPFVLGGAALAVSGAGGISVARLRRRRRIARGTIVAQYDVPPELPPLLAASIVGSSPNPVPAELVHLAVSGAIRIEDGEPEQGLFGPKKAQPVLRLLDPSLAVDELNGRALTAVFPSGSPGDAFTLPKQDQKFAKRMQDLTGAGAAEATRRGYFEKVRSPAGRMLGFVGLALTAVLVVFVVLGMGRNTPGPVVGIVLGVAALILAVSSIAKQRVHTARGAEAREYLLGVKEFIRVAEADRLRMLQSYTGAERRADGTVDVIHVYERLLPYAMLFGLEKEWVQTLEVRYRDEPGYTPYWYPAVAVAGLSGFSSSISQFTSSLTSSVSYTSSSSGGSTGGGFVGGGGGGGFTGGR